MQESEYVNTWCIIHSKYEYNYKVITRGDTILQEYYITDSRKCENTRRCTSMNSTNGAHQFTGGKLERHAWGPRRIGFWTVCWGSTLPLHFSGQQLGESTRSKLQDLDMRIQGSQNSLESGDANARWRTKISTRVSINSNHKHAYRNKRDIVGDIQQRIRKV